jgi:beta-lactam-binding protein with PASTA domain
VAPVIIATDATLVSRHGLSAPSVQSVTMAIDGQLVMPSVTGLSLREAMRVLTEARINVRPLGDGVVVSQAPEPGTPIAAGDTTVLRLERARPVPAPVSGGGS